VAAAAGVSSPPPPIIIAAELEEHTTKSRTPAIIGADIFVFITIHKY
jgi:hypothetical protein